MNMRKFTVLLFLWVSCTIAVFATVGSLSLSINKESGIYEKGERAFVSCHTDITPADSLIVSVSYNNKVGKEFRILPTSTDFIVSDQSLDSTCAVMVEVKDCQGKSASIGYVVAPEGFRAGYEEPADLMDYWDNLKKQLKALPMQVKTTLLTIPQQYQNKFTCEDVEINCLGPAPMRAYVAKPVGAMEKSLPIIILCRAAGVKGDWCRCSVDECVGNAALGNGALSLDLNAHGMLNGQSRPALSRLRRTDVNGPRAADRGHIFGAVLIVNIPCGASGTQAAFFRERGRLRPGNRPHLRRRRPFRNP